MLSKWQMVYFFADLYRNGWNLLKGCQKQAVMIQYNS